MPVVQALLPSPGERVDLERDALRGWLAQRYALEGDRCRTPRFDYLGDSFADRENPLDPGHWTLRPVPPPSW